MIGFFAFICVILSLEAFADEEMTYGWWLTLAACILWAMQAIQDHQGVLLAQQLSVAIFAIRGLRKKKK